MTETAPSEERYIKNENLIQSQNIERAQSNNSETPRLIEKVYLAESESMGNNQNNENLEESTEKVSLKISNSIISEHIDAHLNDSIERVSLKESDSVINEYNDTKPNSVSPRLLG